jgi:hypothetical protein
MPARDHDGSAAVGAVSQYQKLDDAVPDPRA